MTDSIFPSCAQPLRGVRRDRNESDDPNEGVHEMEPFDLSIWLPALFGLGLVVMGLMFAFTAACNKV